MKKRIHVCLAGILTSVLCAPVLAQQKLDSAALPDDPQPKQESTGQTQSKGVLGSSVGLIARRSYVFPEIAYTSGALTDTQKFELFLNRSTSPAQIFSSLAGAAIGQARDSLPGYGQGWSGYGKRFGSSLASGASTQLFGTYFLPSLLHEDPRFFVTYQGGFKTRIGHALKRVVVTPTDDGGQTFNLSGTLGPLMAEGLANVYLPDGERTAGKTFGRFGIRIAWTAASNIVKEYWPTIFKDLGISKVAPSLKPEPAPTPPGDSHGE